MIAGAAIGVRGAEATLFARAAGAHLKTLPAEQLGHHCARVGIVVNEKNANVHEGNSRLRRL